jgi:AcrR family transcriptional regulator
VTQQARAAATRTNLLMGAARAFARRGYTATTTNDILDEAGATKGSLYFHFASKEEIAVAVSRLQYEIWPAVVADARARAATPLDALLDILEETVDRFQHDIVVRASVRLTLERDLVSEEMPLPFVGWERLLCDLLQDAAAQGQLRPDVDPQVEARVMVAAYYGIQHRSLVLAERRDLAARCAEFWMRWLPAISVDESLNARVLARGREVLAAAPA